MHYEDIKHAMRKKGVTSADLARHLGVAPSVVSNVIHGAVKSARVANAIATICGARVADLWPGLYDVPATKESRVAALLGTPPKRTSRSSSAKAAAA